MITYASAQPRAMVIELWNTGLAVLAMRGSIGFPRAFAVISIAKGILFNAASGRWRRYFGIGHQGTDPIAGKRHDSEEHPDELENKFISIIW